ncbi:MAG: Transcriptional regulatory protein BasR [Saezia sanguinis]
MEQQVCPLTSAVHASDTMKVLIVEDDSLLRSGLTEALAQQHYACDATSNASQANRHILSQQYSAILLDLGLPDTDGLSLLRQWRNQKIETPVMIITARDALEDRVQGLDAGADDYLIKPFELVELFARLRAIIRRHQNQSDNLITVGNIALDLANRQVTLHGNRLDLTAREFAILSRLMLKKGQAVAREILQQDIYSWHDNLGSNTLEVYIHHLRQKLGKDTITTVRGVGYRLEDTL